MKPRHIALIDPFGCEAQFLANIGCPIDEVIDSVEATLGMTPKRLDIKIVLLKDKQSVRIAYFETYMKRKGQISFISMSRKIIYLSVEDIDFKSMSHEIAHAVVDAFFTERPSYVVHELIAKYVGSKP